jgi:hypothetical protein
MHRQGQEMGLSWVRAATSYIFHLLRHANEIAMLCQYSDVNITELVHSLPILITPTKLLFICFLAVFGRIKSFLER